MDIQKEWDKNKTYLSPSGEQAAIFIDNKWQSFIRQDVIPKHLQQSITYNQPEQKEFSLFSGWRKDTDADDDYSGTIKHFQD